MKHKSKPLNNIEQFSIKPHKYASIPEEELIVGGDAPRMPKRKKLIAEMEELYRKFKKETR